MMKPRRTTPARMQTAPGDDRHRARDRDRSRGIARGQGQDDAKDDRRKRGIRPEDQDAARTEKRIDEQRDDRRVEAVDRGHAGCDRISDADRHQHRRQDDAGDDVIAQPGELILAQDFKAGTQPRGLYAALPAVFWLKGSTAPAAARALCSGRQ